MDILKNENGMSIVEVIAAFVILSILLISILGILVQTKKTNASSENIQDATYIAQAEMEALYLIANSSSSVEKLLLPSILINGHTYTKNNSLSSANINECATYNGAFGTEIEKTAIYDGMVNGYNATIKINLTCRPKNNIVGATVIELKRNSTTNPVVKIQNAYLWK